MKYFKNIQTLSELKKQFRALAIANHPDKGGDTAVMQEINAEFDAMFQVLKNRPEAVVTEQERKEDGRTYRRHFYTENGWEGSRYDRNLRTTDISARVKVYTKERYPNYKFSVRTEYYSGGSSIYIKLLSGPVPAFTADAKRDYISTMSEVRNYPGLTDEVRAVLTDVVDYCNSYNYDDSDSMTDYFDTNFYLHIYVGSFEKPYQVVTPKAKKVSGKTARRADRLQGEAVESVAPSCQDPEAVAVMMVDYSAKAVAVIGDTAPIKEDLKAMGGRFNRALTVEGQKVAGWIFSKSKEAEVMAYINKLNTSAPAQAVAAEAIQAAAPVQDQPEETAPAFWAAPGRMGCVVCNGLVWYIAAGDWVAMDESGVYCTEEGEPLDFAGEADVMRNAPKRDEGRRGVFFLHEWEAYKYAEELQKAEAESMVAAEPMTEAEPIEAETVEPEQVDEAADDIAKGVELLQGLSDGQIYRYLLSASKDLRECPEFWRMLNTGEDMAAAIGRTALACLLTLGRKVKQGAA